MTAAAPAAPLLLRLDGQHVLGVGGGRVAATKLLPLVSDHGAQVTVVAPELDARLRGAVEWLPRDYAGAHDLDGAMLAVAATNRPDVNAQVARDAAARGVWCVRSDGDGDGTAAFPATLRRGRFTIAIGTDGLSPTLARSVRLDLEERYGPEYGALVELLGQLRGDPAVRARLAALDDEARRRAWRSIPLPDILDLLRSGSVESAKEAAAACLSSSSD